LFWIILLILVRNFPYLFHFYLRSGHLSGGAQVSPHDSSSPRELTVKLETVYQSLQKQVPEENCMVQELYNMWLGGAYSE